MSKKHALTSEDWETVLKRLFTLRRGRLSIPHEPYLTYEDAVMTEVEIDHVRIKDASSLLAVLAPALRSIPSEALQTIVWLAVQGDPANLRPQDLASIVPIEEILGSTAIENMDEMIEQGYHEMEIAEHLGVAIELVQLRAGI
jgi:hypothetical protein